MANEWDVIDDLGPSPVTINNALFENYGHCIKTWGYGKTPGTQFVDANQNRLGNLGRLEFHATGGIADGILSAPGLPFFNDPNTGLHRSAADTIDIVTGGVSRLRISSTGVSVLATNAWQNPSYVNGWADVSAFTALRYRLTSEGKLELLGVPYNGSADMAFTLPVGYRPAVKRGFAIGATAISGTVAPYCFVEANGDVSFVGINRSLGAFVCGIVSLD